MTETLSGDVAAGGDPYAAALAENPYNAVPLVGPDDGAAALLRAQQRLQRPRLPPHQDVALRALRDLPSRLAWDLLTLGTTPAVPPGRWEQTRALLWAGRRAEARSPWVEELRKQPDAAGPLHV